MPGITNPTEEYFKDGLWGWDGTRWRKAGLLFSYTAEILGQAVDTTASTGVNDLLGTAVPAGEVWVITAMEVHNITSGVSAALLGVMRSSVFYAAASCGALAQVVGLPWGGTIYLVAGDRAAGRLKGCTAGDDIYFTYFGYKMAIT